jgi:hypothetical protein
LLRLLDKALKAGGIRRCGGGGVVIGGGGGVVIGSGGENLQRQK